MLGKAFKIFTKIGLAQTLLICGCMDKRDQQLRQMALIE